MIRRALVPFTVLLTLSTMTAPLASSAATKKATTKKTSKTTKKPVAKATAAPVSKTPAAAVPTSPPATAAPTSSSAKALSPAAVCARNKAAGKIIYLSNFNYAAAPGILDVVAAADLDYYSDICLDVDIKVGGAQNQALVAAGTATLARVGSPNDLILSQDNGVDAAAVATYTNVPEIALITMADKVPTLKDLEGKTIGYKGSMPPEITAMLKIAGVDMTKVKTVGVGFDASILPRGQVDGLTGFKSNEVVTLRNRGEKIRVFDPYDYGVKVASGTIIANPAFLKTNPDVVASFLWATFKAYSFCVTHTDDCLALAAKRSTAGYNTESERARWTTEVELTKSTAMRGKGIGVQTIDQWQPGADILVQNQLVKATPDLKKYVDVDVAAMAYDGAALKATTP